MKTYVLTVSKVFPKKHKNSGSETIFLDKIACACFCEKDCEDCCFKWPKKHTIRSNYDLWKKRAKEINEGKALLSVRYWSGKPYRSKQVEFCQLTEIGLQKLSFFMNNINFPYIYEEDEMANYPIYGIDLIARNDGLLLSDFKEWFKDYDLSKPMAVIHFTPFRY